MEYNSQRVADAEQQLYDLLGPELAEVTQAVTTAINAANPYIIPIPDANTVDLNLEDIASIVARSSNAYGRVARFAGIARAEAKIAKGRYDRKYKKSRRGANEAERDVNAMEICHDEHVAWVTAEAIAELADALESSARITSESARKILDKAFAMNLAERREGHGHYQDSDFRSY